jgi:hypothetical protein
LSDQFYPSHHDRGDDRERSTGARQAAEALFKPKGQSIESLARETAPVGEAVHKPRVLAVSAPALVPHEGPKAMTTATPATTRIIPAAQFARIRAWVKYGMTIAQVAEVYGVTTGEIERVLRTV